MESLLLGQVGSSQVLLRLLFLVWTLLILGVVPCQALRNILPQGAPQGLELVGGIDSGL